LIFWADEIYLFSKVRISMAMAIELWSTLLQQTKVENGNQWRWDKKGIYVKMQSTTDSHFFWLLLGIQIQIVLCWFFGFSVFRLVFTHSSFFLRCSFFYNWACEWNPSRMRISFRTLIFLTRPLIFWKYISRILEREYWLNG
jgi:hypothetical protein